MKNVFITKEECQKIIDRLIYEDECGTVEDMVETIKDSYMTFDEKVIEMEKLMGFLKDQVVFRVLVSTIENRYTPGAILEEAPDTQYYKDYLAEPLKEALKKRVMELS